VKPGVAEPHDSAEGPAGKQGCEYAADMRQWAVVSSFGEGRQGAWNPVRAFLSSAGEDLHSVKAQMGLHDGLLFATARFAR